MAGRRAAGAVCSALRRAGSGCLGAASKAWRGMCEHHGLVALAAERGWRARGSRRVQVFVGDKGDQFIVADSPKELLAAIYAKEGVTDAG
jgi:hypothetical protein